MIDWDAIQEMGTRESLTGNDLSARFRAGFRCVPFPVPFGGYGTVSGDLQVQALHVIPCFYAFGAEEIIERLSEQQEGMVGYSEVWHYFKPLGGQGRMGYVALSMTFGSGPEYAFYFALPTALPGLMQAADAGSIALVPFSDIQNIPTPMESLILASLSSGSLPDILSQVASAHQ